MVFSISSIFLKDSLAKICFSISILLTSASDSASIFLSSLIVSASIKYINSQISISEMKLTFLLDFLFLISDEELSFTGFDWFVVLKQSLWYSWLSHSYCYNFYTRCPFIAIILESISKLLIKGIKLINVNFLKSVLTAELIDFMTINTC